MNTEPILTEDPTRFCLFPIKYPDIWEEYKRQQRSQWTAEEVQYASDLKDWEKLSSDEKFFIENILAFFAGSDGIVLENLVENFCREVQIPEARCAYAFQAAMENVHCVTGETKILTDKGYFPIKTLLGENVNIWNGEEFTQVEIVYTGDSPILKVELSNGMELDCTPSHKWLIKSENSEFRKVETKELKIGDILSDYKLPIMKNLICTGNLIYSFLDVPINYSLETKIRWLEDYIDETGFTNINSGSISICSVDLHILKEVQLMLTTMGILTNIYKRENFISALDISCRDVISLINLGFKPKLLNLSYCEKFINKNNLSIVIKVEKVTHISDLSKTYCFNEPKRGTGIFNGILTGQSEVYSLLIDTFVKNPKRKKELFEAVVTIPCVKEKADWAIKWMNPERSFSERLIAFTVVEGVFFSGSFCAIFWLKSRGKMCSALGTSNEWISRDEGMHTDFAILLFSKLINKPSQEMIENIFKEAVSIESRFITESLPCRLVGMNSDLMERYIKFVADRLITQLGYKKIYNESNPFPFMETLGLQGKTNFFEKEVTEYQSAAHLNHKNPNDEGDDFSLDEDF